MILEKIKVAFLGRLWKKFALLFLVVISIPICILGYFLIQKGEKAVRDAVLANYQEIVQRVSVEIDSLVNTPQSLLLAAAKIMGVINIDSWKQETVLVELALNHPYFKKIVSVDLKGEVMASSQMNRSQSYLKEAWETAKKGESFFSDLKISPQHIPYMVISVPIKEGRNVVSVLIAQVNLKGIWEVIDKIKIGESGQVYIVSAKGGLIAHKDRKRVYSNEDLGQEKEVQAVLSGQNGALEKVDFIYSYAFLKKFGWGVIFKQSREEAYYFSKMMRFHSIIILILSELIAVGISVFLANRMSSPLKKIIAQMKEVAKGDLEHQIGTVRLDEIGDLIDTFNGMVEKLKVARLKERLAVVGEASLRIAHEFKNSLCALKAFVQLFPKRRQEPDFIDKFEKDVPIEMARLEGMVKDLSEQTKEIRLHKIEFNIRELMQEVIEFLKEKLEDKEIDISFVIKGDRDIVSVDPEKIREVFLNFLLNAAESIDKRGTIRVIISNLLQKGMNIVIQDTGCGIPEEIQNKIFDPFFSTKKKGFGLGLAYCKKIINLHNGEISVKSAANQGTTFNIYLPYQG
ncbi:ATP-binding protein [Candidatus Auribacterota bacterium]